MGVPTVTNNPAAEKPEKPVVGYNNFLLRASEGVTASASAALPSSPVDLEQARRAHEEFVKERLAAAESVLHGATSNLNETRKEQEKSKASWEISTWFMGGLREQLANQEKAEAKFVQASQEKVAELKKRETLSQELMLASQQLTQQAQQYDRSGNTAKATEARTMATQLLELTPAVLEADNANFASLSSRAERVLSALASGPNGVAAAREAMALARGVVSQWNGSIDTETGKRPRASAIASTKDLQKSYASINEEMKKNFGLGNRMEYAILTGVVITVGVVAATVATGGLVLPALLGGATIGGGLFSGAILGIAAGTAVGAAAAYGEAAGNLRYGKSWSEVSAKAQSDTWSHFKTAASSVAFGKVAQSIGWVIGKMGVVGSIAMKPFQGAISKLPPRLVRTLSPFGGRVTTSMASATTSGAVTVADGLHAQLMADREFEAWAQKQPHMNPNIQDPKSPNAFDPVAYHKAWLKFREANHVTYQDVLWQAGENAIISGTASMAYAGPKKIDTFKSRVLRNTVGVGAGVGTEYAVDKFREAVDHNPVGEPMSPYRGDEIDSADAMRIAWASTWGKLMGRAQSRARGL